MLELVAFVCGAAVMIMELAGSRLMAPHLGTSILVWTSLIGVILAALSAGYWLGGKAADRNPSSRKLASIIAGAAICVFSVALVSPFLLGAIAMLPLPLEVSSALGAIILFAPASLLLGMVSPYIIRVAIQERKVEAKHSGALIGRFFALSSVGSIIGTFMGGYVLIAWLGSGVILFSVAALLLAAVILCLLSSRADHKHPRPAKRLIALCLAGITLCFASMYAGHLYAAWLEKDKGLVEIDTRYNHLRIYPSKEGARAMRVMVTDPKMTQSGMYLDAPNELALSYTRNYALAFSLRPEAKRLLMLGGGGYSVPKYLLATRPGMTLDVVEIDPGITEASRRHFALPKNERLRIHHEDARTFLNAISREKQKNSAAPAYDLILGDTFNSAYNIPFHIATREAFQAVNDALAQDGIYICNVISGITGDQGRFLRAMHAACAEVFPEVRLFPSQPFNSDALQNVMLVAAKGKEAFNLEKSLRDSPSQTAPSTWQAKEKATALAMLRTEWQGPLPKDLPPLVDDYAPVERYSMFMLRN